MPLFQIPELSLVLLVGPSGCGKSTFARRHFRPTEVVSSDYFRGVVSDDESNQSVSYDAFELVHSVIAKRLKHRRFTVVDATNVQADARKPLLELARRYHYLTSAIVFDLDEPVCQQHNQQRPDRTVPERVITHQRSTLVRNLPILEREGIGRVFHLRTLEEVQAVQIERMPLWIDKRTESGPFDLVGDVHGCLDELLALLAALGYHIGHETAYTGETRLVVEPPPGRRLVFVGDLCDRGPDTPGVFRLVMDLVARGKAYCVMGNHDFKLLRKLRGNDVKLSHGIAETLDQLSRQPSTFLDQLHDFLDRLQNHYVLDAGRLVVAHAGLREDLQGRVSGKVRTFAMYGDVTGQMDEHGLPVRRNWAADYRGSALVVYGHTPTAEPNWQNNTVNIDTGCVFGGKLTALRYPEREVVSVPALRQYCEPGRPFLGTELGPEVDSSSDSESVENS